MDIKLLTVVISGEWDYEGLLLKLYLHIVWNLYNECVLVVIRERNDTKPAIEKV